MKDLFFSAFSYFHMRRYDLYTYLIIVKMETIIIKL